jgi:hypothetical protein
MSVLSHNDYLLKFDHNESHSCRSIADEAISNLNKRQDDVFKKSLDKHLPGWVIADLAGRIRCDSALAAGITVYYLDEKAILQINRIESQVVSKDNIHTFSADFKYKVL